MIALNTLHPMVKVIAIWCCGRLPATDCLKMAKAVGAATMLAKPCGAEELDAAINEGLRLRE